MSSNIQGSIEKTLSQVLRLEPVSTVEKLAVDDPKHPRRFLLRKTDSQLVIRIAEQLDLEVEAIVCDSELGSLGLIHIVPADSSSVGDWLRQRIGQAVHLRQLLLDQVRPGKSDAGKTAYAIELVLVVPSGEPESAVQLGDVLRSLIREAEYLHSLGINFWRQSDDGSLEDAAAVRRAFSWLLRDSENWYSRPLAEPDGNQFGQLAAVELENFRVAGKRRWVLERDRVLHLVHGPNGSGKSSFCEALEIVMTGKVERLAEANHAKVLTNRTAQSVGATAAVTLQAAGRAQPRKWLVSDHGVESPLQSSLAGPSFRLDQTLADSLSKADAAARARLFLEAFFPDQRARIKVRDEAHKSLKTAFEKLPKRLRTAYSNDAGEPDIGKINEGLGWTSNSSVPWDRVMALLPVSREQVMGLTFLLPAEFTEQYGRSGEVAADLVEKAIPALQKGLAGVAAEFDKTLKSLNDAVAILEEYGEEAVSALPEETEDLDSLMNKWLELVALTDIFERENRLLAAVSAARENHYVFSKTAEPLVAGLGPAQSSEERQRVLAGLKKQRDDLRARLMRYGRRTEDSPRSTKVIKPLADFHLESLAASTALGVFGDAWRNVSRGLDHAVREAFTAGGQASTRRVVEIRSGESLLARVGEEHWGKELRQKAARARDALQAVSASRADIEEPAGALDKVWSCVQELGKSAAGLLKIDAEALDAFTKLVGDDGPLSRAVNEVMALLTPARWAYEDIVTRADFESGKTSLEAQTPDEVPLRLRLNTAELNTFALTLFLLCARRIENPLRTIILDDPLQNMDELTVTTVARGLRRLLRLWERMDKGKPAWRLVILLHSEEDIGALRSEVACSTYLLPWLSAQESLTGEAPPIKLVPSFIKSELQPLAQVLRESPQTSAAATS